MLLLKPLAIAALSIATLTAAQAAVRESKIGLVNEPLIPHEVTVDPVLAREPVADPVLLRVQVVSTRSVEVSIPPVLFDPTPLVAQVFMPHGPFMTAVDLDRAIVNSQKPLVLYPREWSAMAQARLPADCPRASAEEDEKECNQ